MSTSISRFRLLLSSIAIVTVALAVEVHACWWSRHCSCHHDSNRFGAQVSQSPTFQPQQQATQQQTPVATPMYYTFQPVAIQPVQYMAGTPQQGLVTDVRGVIELIRLITLYEVQNVVIDGLVVHGFQLDGINAADSVFNATIVGVVSQGNGRSGIAVNGASRVRVEACLVLQRPFLKTPKNHASQEPGVTRC